MFYQLEYFVPVIPQAGIKSVFFIDFGQVYNDDEEVSFSNLKYNAGFGFRWMTPIAPFRFEWAYPYDMKTGKFGEGEFIFSLGI